MRIYTSGCPHDHTRFMYIMELPPKPEVKKCIPKSRSNDKSMSVMVSIGKAEMMRTILQSDVHTNIGIFMSVIPGARILRTVTRKLTPESKLPRPDICKLHIQ